MAPSARASTTSVDATRKRWQAVSILALCGIWVFTGLLPHDPWKPYEAHTFGLVLHILQTGDWVVPTLAGEPFLERPPAYILTAAALASALGGAIEAHDAARLASALYLAITLLLLARAARELYGPEHAWVAPLALIGCVGLLVPAHQLVGALPSLAGFAAGLWGLSLASTRPLAGGVALGSGIGLAFLSQGVVAPVTLLATALTLPLVCTPWRSRTYALALTLAVAAAAPWLLIWPLALEARSPDLFAHWLWAVNLDRLPGIGRDPLPFMHGQTLLMLLWYAWPALPLSLWMLRQRGWGVLAAPAVRLPLTLAVVGLLLLPATPEARELQALPLLLPLALLATASIDSLDRGAANFLDWFGVATFGLCALILWLGYLALHTGQPGGIARELAQFHPGFEPRFETVPLLLALLATMAWIALVSRIGRSNRRAIINWAAGITLAWVLFSLFFLAYVDHGRSYRAMISSLEQALPAGRTCVASRGLGETQRAMLHYHAGLLTVREEARSAGEVAACDVLLWQGWAWDADGVEAPWRRVWEGSRAGDRKERYRLYLRDLSPPAATPVN